MTALVPLTVQDALAVAQQLAASGMVPRDYVGKPGAIYAAIDLGASVGLRPMQAVQGIANINGRPALWGDAASAVVMAHPAFDSIDEDDAATALAQGFGRCRVVRKGSPPHEVRFSRDMAQAAGLWAKQGPWSQYPGRMLQMRARAWAFRDRFPDALKGIAVAEEVIDVPATVTVVPDMMPREIGDAETVVEAPRETQAPTPKPDGPRVSIVPPLRDVPRNVPKNAERVPVKILGCIESGKGKRADGSDWTRYEVSLQSDKNTFIAVTFSDTLGPEMMNAVGMFGIARITPPAKDGGRLQLHDMEPAPL